MTLTYFIPLAKVDLARREVWGVAAIEQPDQSNEIMDYDRSKPHFEAWSQRIQKASGGKSRGNVRDSHTTRAVGKVIQLLFDDVAKAVRVGVKILDAETWQKVVEGVFTGFSIGGRYGQRWPDVLNKSLTRYEAIPTELSLVDVPCIPGALFELVKADGSLSHHPFLVNKNQGVAMKDKIKSVLKKQLGELSEEALAALAEEVAAIVEEQQPTQEDEAADVSSAPEGEQQPAGEEPQPEQPAEDQPQPLDAEAVRAIVLEVLAEVGLLEQTGEALQMGAKISGLAKSLADQAAAPLQKAVTELQTNVGSIVKDLAALVVEVETLAKRGASGPVLREIGALSAQAAADLQKAQALKNALSGVNDPMARQALQNEIAKLEIQAIQQTPS